MAVDDKIGLTIEPANGDIYFIEMPLETVERYITELYRAGRIDITDYTAMLIDDDDGRLYNDVP